MSEKRTRERVRVFGELLLPEGMNLAIFKPVFQFTVLDSEGKQVVERMGLEVTCSLEEVNPDPLPDPHSMPDDSQGDATSDSVAYWERL